MPITIKTVTIGTDVNSTKCLAIPPSTAYAAPIDMVGAGLAGAAELWVGVLFDYETTAGGHAVSELGVTSFMSCAFAMGLKTNGPKIPSQLTGVGEWFCGVTTFKTATESVAQITRSGNSIQIAGYGQYHARINSSAVTSVQSATGSPSYGEFTTALLPVNTPAKVAVMLIRITRTPSEIRVYIPNGNLNTNSLTTTSSLSALRARIAARAAAPSSFENHNSIFATISSTNTAEYNAISSALDSTCSFYIQNPFFNHNLRVHGFTIVKTL